MKPKKPYMWFRGKACVWLKVLGLSRSRYYEVTKTYTDGVVLFQQFNNISALRPKSCKAIAWMHHYFQQIGDQMPDRMAIHLPSLLTNTLIYSRMVEDMAAHGDEAISKSQFYNLWILEFPHVTIPKVRSANYAVNWLGLKTINSAFQCEHNSVYL